MASARAWIEDRIFVASIPLRVLLSKRKLINTLFLLSFPFYGIGMYLGIKASASFGTLFAVLPFILILLVHGLDLVYRRQARNMVTPAYWVGLLFLLTLVWSMWKVEECGSWLKSIETFGALV